MFFFQLFNIFINPAFALLWGGEWDAGFGSCGVGGLVEGVEGLGWVHFIYRILDLILLQLGKTIDLRSFACHRLLGDE